jgi:membrane-associated protein
MSTPWYLRLQAGETARRALIRKYPEARRTAETQAPGRYARPVELAVNFLDPQSLITTFGVLGILAIVFAETGLLIGFFLPGDTLLFTAGLLTTERAAHDVGVSALSLPILLAAAPVFAIAGAQFGHYLGDRYGRKLFDRPNSRLFRPEHVEKAEHYFNKFGPARAVVLARFIPVVRTFLNPLAGMLEMRARRFFVWNAIGAVVWTETIILVGHFLGSRVKGIDKYVLPVVALAVLASIIPVVREVLRGRKDPPGTRPQSPGARPGTRPDAKAGRPAEQEERL